MGGRRPDWGSASWFREQLISDPKLPESYFSHGVNGYQKYRHSLILKAADSIQGKSEIKRMLDIGCALGDLGIKLRNNNFIGAELTGIDLIPELISAAKNKNPNFDFQVGALPSLKFSDCSFDLVICSEVIYYLSTLDRVEAVKDILRVLKPNGYLILTSRIDNGERYLTIEYIEKLAQHFAATKSRVLIYNTLYELVARYAKAFVKLDSSSTSAENIQSYRRSSAYSATLRALENPIYRFLTFIPLRLLATLSRVLLGVKFFPYILSRISRIIKLPPTNCVIVLKK